MSRTLPPAITLTDAAAAQLQNLLANSARPVQGLRLSVKNTGCAGMSYKMDYVAEPLAGDERVTAKGVTVFIDPRALLFIIGTEIDYQSSALKSGFVFNNPQETERCGCGESFKAEQPAKPIEVETAEHVHDEHCGHKH